MMPGRIPAIRTTFNAEALRLRILVDNGDYGLVNRGDIAKIEIAIARLREHWPRAEFGVVTEAPARVPTFFPRVAAVAFDDRGGWPSAEPALRVAEQRPGIIGPSAAEGAAARRRAAAPGMLGALRHTFGDADSPRLDYRPAPAAVAEADLVVCAGGGYLTDADPGQASRTLSILHAALQAGVPAAMLGQGIGPLETPELASRAAEILPGLELIAVREERWAPELLIRLGVDPDRIVVTGDDALGLGVALCPDRGGEHLGISVRRTDDTDLTRTTGEAIQAAVLDVANARFARLSPIYISEMQDEDRRGTLGVVGGHPVITSEYGRQAPAAEAVRRAGACRVMVTRTYDAAVFALAQGVPTVCMPYSAHNPGRFEALADQFPGGCRLVPLDTRPLRESLETAIYALWDRADELREPLRERARSYAAAARAVHRRLFGAVEARRAVAADLAAGG